MDIKGDEPVVRTEYIISAQVLAMVDKMCFLAVYGFKTILEAKVPATSRAAFAKFVLERHSADGARDQFATAWKAYVQAHPSPTSADLNASTADDELYALLGGDSGDEDDGPAGGAGSGSNSATPP